MSQFFDLCAIFAARSYPVPFSGEILIASSAFASAPGRSSARNSSTAALYVSMNGSTFTSTAPVWMACSFVRSLTSKVSFEPTPTFFSSSYGM